MVKALSSMQDLVFGQAAAADGFLKIPVVGLIALHLLRGHDEFELNRRQLFSRFSKKVIIDVGDDSQPEPPG